MSAFSKSLAMYRQLHRQARQGGKQMDKGSNIKRLEALWKRAEKINRIDNFLCRAYGALEAHSGAITEEVMEGIERALEREETDFNASKENKGGNING